MSKQSEYKISVEKKDGEIIKEFLTGKIYDADIKADQVCSAFKEEYPGCKVTSKEV